MSACCLHVVCVCVCVLCPQIIEENGVRRVLVLPQAEFHPGGHSPLHHPPPPPTHPHLQAFIPHPHPILPHHPPPHLYSGMAGGTGDMNTQYISQYHPAHIYPDQGECVYTRTQTNPTQLVLLIRSVFSHIIQIIVGVVGTFFCVISKRTQI